MEKPELEQLKSEIKKQLPTFAQSPKYFSSLTIAKKAFSFWGSGGKDIETLTSIA